MRTLLYILFLLLITTPVLADKGQNAMKAYNLGEYDRAQQLFVKAISSEKSKSTKAMYNFYLGECYRHKCIYKKAANAYNHAVRANYIDDSALLYMGDCLRACGDYNGAAEAYARYLIKHEKHLTAMRGMESCKMLEKHEDIIAAYDYKNPVDTGYVVQLAKQFNSKYSDYCPAYFGDDFDVVYFTTMRMTKHRKKVNRITGQGNSNIYMTKIDARGSWTEPEQLGDPFSRTIDDGTPCITSDGKTMYFTRCPYDPQGESTAQAFSIERSGGRWGEPQRIIPGNDSTMMVAHPAISPDGETLYFVSDREGGLGGKDIYMSKKQPDGSWGEAENMGGMINSRGDEMFPYVRDDGTLYFSSNGHVGLGGLDIFEAKLVETGRYEVRNLGFPMNSPGDDFGIIFRGMREEGYFSSNRASNKGIDKIYSFVLPEQIFTIEGTIHDLKGNVPNKAFIRIVGTDGTNLKMRATEDGYFDKTLEKDQDYIILFGGQGCENQKYEISTRDKKRSETFNLEIKLKNVKK